jgi:hypothetical protein
MAAEVIIPFNGHPMDICCRVSGVNATVVDTNESVHLHCAHECMLAESARYARNLVEDELGVPALFFAFYVIIVAVACVGNGVVSHHFFCPRT